MPSSRRTRSKARKPKYVSLRRHLASPPPPPRPPPETADPSDMSSAAASDDCVSRRHQLDLPTLHPGHLDREPDVACLLDDRGGGGQPTLAALLGVGVGVSSSSGSPSPASLASPSVNWEEDQGGDKDGLARRALRGRERWAYCRASSVPASSSEEEVASSAIGGDGGVDLWRCATPQALALKLDYEEILAAWSDRGPLYMDGEAPQVVPQFHHHAADPYDSGAFPVLVEVGCGSSSPMKVPEQRACDGDRTAEEGGLSREARVMRYKEKRRNRLFAKRIRYEVRKLNAERRPRVKVRSKKLQSNKQR
ncbi:hypothetical protein BHM03_00055716 [Ensete ventricosum]|nr:hypothetical protein BHM03_00055716 [Ensete ventricosum]